MATLTSLPLEGDGVIENLFYYLWSKDEFDRSPSFRIPDTIIYQFTQPACWYFTSSSGKLKRKTKANTTNGKIEYDFTKNSIGGNILAYYMTKNSQGAFTIEYLDEEGLHDFLYNRDKSNDGILQKFIEPKGSSNSMIRAIWSPKICLLERRVNNHKLYDNRFGLYERAITFEGPDYHSTTDPVKGSILAGDVQHACENIVDHVAEVSFHKYRISRMALNFKVDGQDRVWFLWCSSLRLKTTADKQQIPLSIETGVHVPSFVHMSSMAHVSSSHVVQTTQCASCGSIVEASMVNQVTYKAIITHFEHVLEYMHSVAGSDESKSIPWPPDPSVIEAGGNVGFGILNHMETRSGKKDTYLVSNFSIEVTIPPAIRKLHPTLTDTDYTRYKKDPIFLYQNAKTCEACYLVYADYSMSTLEANLLHRGAPKILRPPRAGLHTAGRLTPMSASTNSSSSVGSRQRRTPADAWTPVAEPRAPKRKPYVQAGGMKFSTPPKLPGGIDTNTFKELSGRANKDAVTHPIDLSSGYGTTPSGGGAEKSMIHQREEQFFAELYNNPNIDKSHPLSHMIESASRMQVGMLQSSSHGSLPDMQFGSASLVTSSSSMSALPPVGMAASRSSPGLKPYASKPKHLRGKTTKKKHSPKKKGRPTQQSSARTTPGSSGSKGFTKSAMDHREFLLQTLNEVRQQLTEPEQTMEEMVEETTGAQESSPGQQLESQRTETEALLGSLDLGKVSTIETDAAEPSPALGMVSSPLSEEDSSFLENSKDLELFDAAKKLGR